MNRMSSAALAHEIAGAAAWLQDGGPGGNAQAGNGLVDGGDDGGRGIEGVEGGAFGTVIFLRRKQRLQLVAEFLPAGILVAAGDRIGKYRQGHRPETGEAGQNPPFLQRRRPRLLLNLFQNADRSENVAGLRFLTLGDGGVFNDTGLGQEARRQGWPLIGRRAASDVVGGS